MVRFSLSMRHAHEYRDKHRHLDHDIRHMNGRLIRLETLVEVAKMQKTQIDKPKINP